MTGYVGLDLGGYLFKIGVAENISAVKNFEQFTPWVHSEDGFAYVGDSAVNFAADQQSLDRLYYNFLRQVDQDHSFGQLAGFNVTALDLVKIIFQKAVLMSPRIALADYRVAVVPSYLTQEQRVATSIAAQRADLKLSAVISQGVAKAIALQDKYSLKAGHVFAIYEWGATQFEFSIFKVLDDKCIEVLVSTSLEQHGGYQCDQKLWQILAEQYKVKRGKELTKNVLNVLDSQLIGTKEGLIKRADRSIEIRDITLDVTLAELESRVSDLVNQTIECVKKAIRIANLSVTEIKDIYLTGGSSQIPLVNSLVKENFTCQITQESQSELAAQGAVIFAQHYLDPLNSRVIKESLHTHDVMILNRSLFHYGLVTSIYDFAAESDKDQNSVIIDRHLPLPVRKQAVFYTDEPWQKIIAFQLTYAKSNSTKLADVHKYNPSQIEFSKGDPKLVEIQLKLRLTEEHTLHCELENQLTGESRMIECPNTIFQRFNSFNNISLQVR